MRKWILLLLVLTISGVVSTATLAQDGGTMDTVFCGDLGAEDCALLEQAQMAGENVTAAAFDLFVDVQAMDGDQTVPISIVGSGAYSGLLDLGGMTAADSSAVGSMDHAVTALRDFNANLILTITLPADMMEGSDAPTTLTLELRLVDGVGYINFDELQPIINDPSLSGWGGLDIASLLGALIEQNPNFLSELSGMGGMMTGGVDPMLLAQLSDPNRMGQYVSITRTDDGAGALATFETTFDLAGFMADPAMQEMMRGQMNDQAGAMGQGMSDEQLQQMFQNSRFLVRQQIDTATGLTSSISVEFDLGDMGDNNVSMTAMINYRYDAVPTIDAPEDAAILPYEQLLGMVGGMMGGQMGGANATPVPMMTPTFTPGAGDVTPQVTQEATAAG
ncbi:MAG: hypothetical protein IAE80_07230 [Anaerolinea sp.]|nr:hypothetical protein [Anaerolinea sp.]